jgi:hypothetical protein
LLANRDQQVKQLQAQKLKPRVETRSALAIIGVDGGRLQIRGEEEGPGAHRANWREDKIAVLATAAITAFESDPKPDLPDCFRNREYVEILVREMSGQSSMRLHDPEAESPVDSPPVARTAAYTRGRVSPMPPRAMAWVPAEPSRSMSAA